MSLKVSNLKIRKGFSLVELAVVVVIVGVLAAFGVPRLLKSVERSKAGESFNYLGAIRTAQERQHQAIELLGLLVERHVPCSPDDFQAR